MKKCLASDRLRLYKSSINMNKVPSLWFGLFGVAAFALSSSAFAELLDTTGAVPSVTSAKDKICVVSHNTGLAMWYNTDNHGFTPTVAPENGFAATEDLVFGKDHQLAATTFDMPSVYSFDRNASEFSRFVSGSTKGLGAPVGYVFGKDRQLYLTSRSPACELELIDAKGILVEATLSYGVAERTKKQAGTLAAVPEPSSIALFGAAALALATWRRRR